MRRERWWTWQYRCAPYFFLSPFVILAGIFLGYPLVRSFLLSLHKTIGPAHATFVGGANYRFLSHDLRFGFALLNTAVFTAVYVALQTPLSLGLALLLSSGRVRLRSFFRFAFFSTYLVGQVFVAVVFFQLFMPHGLINQLIALVLPHAQPINWLSDPNLAMVCVLVAALWLYSGYGMIYLLAALAAVDRRLYDAAKADGAGSFSILWHVTLPSIRPVLAYLVIAGTIMGFQLFELPYVLLQGYGPGGRGLTIVMYLFAIGFGTGDLGYASAIGWALLAILLVISIGQVVLLKAAREPST